jgi:acetyltransferase-like isoleucine patch superfamily enzyme
MAAKTVKSNIDEVEALVATVSGIDPATVSALSVAGSAISIVGEVLGKRAGEASETAVAMRRLVRERLGLSLDRIHLVRPGWLPRAETAARRREQAADRIEAVLRRRERERVIRVGGFQENLDEDKRDLFGSFGAFSRIRAPTEILGTPSIHLGSWVSLGRYGKILILDDFTGAVDYIAQHHPGVSVNPRAVPFTRRAPTVVFKDGVSLGDSFFVAASCRIEIGQHVVTSARLFLTDCAHVFDDPRLPVQLQGNTEGTPLIVEDGCWLGVGVSIIKGVRVGTHSVVGSNSVVNRDVPAYAIVGGVPARIIRMQDPSVVPASLDNRPLNRDATVQIVRSIIEGSLGHVLALDLDLRNDGLLTQDVAASLVAQLPGFFPVSAPAVQAFIDASRTVRDLGERIYDSASNSGA